MGEAEFGSGVLSAPVESPVACLRCGREDTVRLEKARLEANTCYRCRGCGHIFSPADTFGD
jgi:predicted RNA-binding Zn-ribbon protein involved in translation (DUF1610 family)